VELVVARNRAELVKARGEGPIALVPTMGALHEGHRALIREARALAARVVVSVFVNPLQFGPGEDLSRYPRTLEADLDVCRAEGVAVVFTPAAEDMYAADRQVGVSAGRMGAIVEGAARPGHFDGVLTVVLKLFNLVQPDLACFGQKDAQQLAVIRRMVADLDLPIDIVGVPTVREPDGLAMSSRNRFLSAQDRERALALSRALSAGALQATPSRVVAVAQEVLGAAGLDPDYLTLVDPATFEAVPEAYKGEAVLAVAVRVGRTRLIDNAFIRL
jgi:pantoate--beta-alanine ligase